MLSYEYLRMELTVACVANVRFLQILCIVHLMAFDQVRIDVVDVVEVCPTFAALDFSVLM